MEEKDERFVLSIFRQDDYGPFTLTSLKRVLLGKSHRLSYKNFDGDFYVWMKSGRIRIGCQRFIQNDVRAVKTALKIK